MRPFSRLSILLLVAVHSAACGRWQGRIEGPREALADPAARHVRLTRTDNQRVEVRVAEIRGDSIYGTLGGSGPLTCESADPSCSARIPLSEVGFVEVRTFSLIRTVALVAIPVGVIASTTLIDKPCNPLVESC